MNTGRWATGYGLAWVLTFTGCLPFGLGGKSQPKPPPPVETVETTAKRADSLFTVGSLSKSGK